MSKHTKRNDMLPTDPEDTTKATSNVPSEPPINTIEPDKNIEVSTFFQKLGFKVSLVDEELWLPLANFAEVKAQIDHLITQARVDARKKTLTEITIWANQEMANDYVKELQNEQ